MTDTVAEDTKNVKTTETLENDRSGTSWAPYPAHSFLSKRHRVVCYPDLYSVLSLNLDLHWNVFAQTVLRITENLAEHYMVLKRLSSDSWGRASIYSQYAKSGLGSNKISAADSHYTTAVEDVVWQEPRK